jgi:hypothetical protein
MSITTIPIELLSSIIPIESLFYFCKTCILFYNARNALTSKLLLQQYGISIEQEEINRMNRKNINIWQCMHLLKRESNLHTLGQLFPSHLFPSVYNELFPIFGIYHKNVPLTIRYSAITNANLFFYKTNERYPITMYLRMYPELTFFTNNTFRYNIFDLPPTESHTILSTLEALSTIETIYLYRFFLSYAIDCLLEKRYEDVIPLIKHNFPIFRVNCEYNGLPRSDLSIKALRRFLNHSRLINYYIHLYFNPDSKAPLKSTYDITNFWNICKKRANGTYAKAKMAELYPGIF